MARWFRFLKQCPLFVMVSLIILVISLSSVLTPQQSFSRRYGDYLAAAPRFDMERWWDGSFIREYTKYVSDQIWLRDNWLLTRSLSEFFMLKTQSNGVVYGRDGHLFSAFNGYPPGRMVNNLDAIDLFAYQAVSKVHVMIIPTASYPLIDYLPTDMPSADQGYYISRMNQYLDNYASVVNIKDVLAINANEYIYYRTDPHWTTYGAWLAYSQFASATEQRAIRYSPGALVSVDGYLGSNYSKGKPLFVTPDTIEYFDLPGTVTFDGVEHDGLYDYERFSQVDKYSAFLHGSHAYSVIKGEHDSFKRSNIVVISDSFGYSFIPMLTQNYNEIIFVDLRFYVGSFEEFRSTRYDDILIMLGFEAICNNTNLVKIVME